MVFTMSKPYINFPLYVPYSSWLEISISDYFLGLIHEVSFVTDSNNLLYYAMD